MPILKQNGAIDPMFIKQADSMVALIMLIVAIMIFMLGYLTGKKAIQAQAVSNNVARYEIVDKHSGKVEFEWNSQTNKIE